MFSHSGNAGSSVTLTSPRAGTHAVNLHIRTSTDLKTWSDSNVVFGTGSGQCPRPIWWTADPDYHPYWYVWAPSINYFNGQFYLYYSLAPDWQDIAARVDAHGKPLPIRRNTTSCIALLTTKTLDPSSSDYQWVDRGAVIEVKGVDPHLVWKSPAEPYLLTSEVPIGVRPVDFQTGLLSSNQPVPVPAIAKRPGSVQEAPCILKRGDWYYLFYAFGDYRKSDYCEWVGRSANYDGPYLDRNRIDLMKAGGTLFARSQSLNGINYAAVGHGSVFTDTDGRVYWVGQYYPGGDKTKGRHLWLSTIEFDKAGWPVCALTPPFP